MVDPRPRRRLDALGRAGTGGSFWLAVDLVVALCVSWIPLVADYTRFSTTRRAAFWGVGLGYLLPTLFQFGFGSILVLSHPSIDGPTAVLITVAAGGIGSFARPARADRRRDRRGVRERLLGGGLSQNVLTEVPQRALVVGTAALATVGALALDLTEYQQFLLLLGAFFVPLFGVLLADWLLNGAHYEPADIFRGPAVRPGMIGAWLAGFPVYEWLAQTQGLGFWTDLLAHLSPPESSIGASLPSFGVAFALGAAVSFAARRSGGAGHGAARRYVSTASTRRCESCRRRGRA